MLTTHKVKVQVNLSVVDKIIGSSQLHYNYETNRLSDAIYSMFFNSMSGVNTLDLVLTSTNSFATMLCFNGIALILVSLVTSNLQLAVVLFTK